MNARPSHWGIGLVVALLAAVGGAPAHALQVTAFDAQIAQPSGASAIQAGGHPDVTLSLDLPTLPGANGTVVPEENVKDLVIELPEGVQGDAGATPTCAGAQLAGPSGASCSADTQIGVAHLWMGFDMAEPLRVPIFNLVVGRDAPAQFGFNARGVTVRIGAGLRGGPEPGLTASIRSLSQALPLVGARFTLWGVPADPVHDAERFDPLTARPGAVSSAPRRPFLTFPTSCSDVAPVTRLRVRSWQRPDDWTEARAPMHVAGQAPQGPAGCDRLDFAARLEAQPETRRRGTPSGLTLTVRLAQDSDPDGLTTATMRKAVVSLPAGVALSPSGTNGLVACDAASTDDGDVPACPGASRLGDVELTTPLLTGPLRGAVFLVRPRDPFDGTLGIQLVAEGAGIALRLDGRVAPDPATGRLTATLDDLPQLPLETMTLRFYDGPTALLALPATCGPATTVATLTPHSGGAPLTATSTFEVSGDGSGAPCPPRGFSPGFAAGSATSTAGADAPFTLRFARGDEDQELGGFSASLPAGLLGRIAGVPALCPDNVAAVGACDGGSRIGSAAMTAGPGPEPVRLTGGVHLTGPYRGAPFGLAIVVPAVAGPLRLGTVVVRAAIEIDRSDASLRVVADPLPTALVGIPLQVRTVELTLDRSGFMTNPTSCAPLLVDGQVRSTEGTVASVSSRYAVGGCADLPFAPRMALRVGGRGSTRKGAAVPLRVTLRMGAGQARSRAIRVTLPDTLNARFPALNRACAPADLAADRCGSRIGNATVVTPVLRDPLRGAIFLVWDRTHRMPGLVVRLGGQIGLDLRGRLRIAGRRIATTFDPLPDVPISRLDLRFAGGAGGALGANVDLCSAAAGRRGYADVSLRGHNGKHVRQSKRLLALGCRATR